MTPDTEPTTYTSNDVVEQAGITYRQLDHWTKLDILHPVPNPEPGIGHPRNRHYPKREVDIARLLGLIVKVFDTRLETFRRLADELRAERTADIGELATVHLAPGITINLDELEKGTET